MNIDKINNQYAFLFENADYEPLDIETNGVTQIPSSTQDAFALNSPFTKSRLKSKVEINKDMYSGVLIRSVIPYSTMCGILNDFPRACFVFSNYMNSMLVKAEMYHNGKYETLTFKRPGTTNDYLREMENAAGYELRLYVNWKEKI